MRRLNWILCAGLVLAPSVATALVLPPEGLTLSYIHVQFEWSPVGGATSYQLQVVPDDGNPDPFALGIPVVDVVVGVAQPRTVVTTGLVFDETYAWRVRGDDGSPLPWGPTHRFDIAALPTYVPEMTVTTGPGTMEPGLTLFNIRSPNGTVPSGMGIAVDAAGDPVWFLEPGGVGDIRMLPNGRLLFVGGSRAVETTLNGQVTYASPDDVDLTVHHEVFPMPNGNVLAAIARVQDAVREGALQHWRGDRLIEFDRTDNQIVWEWNTFDHYSTLDFDPSVMGGPSAPGLPEDNGFAWTHTNAVIYNAADNSVYLSARHISRITRIDYATGNIVYNMGFTMPSGDDDFGDNLFSWQHAPQMLANGNMVVYDNGNRRDHIEHTPATGVTKAIELAFTGNPPTDASIVWEYTLPEYTAFVGDADRLPGGNTLINAGPTATLYEVDAAGVEVVWKLELPAGTPDYLIYRAERIPALNPDVPGDTDGDGLADEVDNCPDTVNPLQEDCDLDGFGDVCALALGLMVACPECNDLLDNDADLDFDFPDDGECEGLTDASEEENPCSDTIDNDSDGDIDFPADRGCHSPDGLSELADCADGLDNDGDAMIDGDDPGCVNANQSSREDPECADGIDNDGDLDTDFPDDLGCQAAWSQKEAPRCSDLYDNEGDLLVDLDDPQCDGDPAGALESGTPGCGMGPELILLLPFLPFTRRRS